MHTPWPPHPTTAPKDIEWRLPRHARSVGRARTLFREQAASWTLPPDVTDTAELLLSELMTNAYRHAKVPAGREIWARCVLTDNRLRITVTDASDTLPAPNEACLDDESGRGLALVTALADDWGAQRRAYGIGKEVWVEVSLAAALDTQFTEKRAQNQSLDPAVPLSSTPSVEMHTDRVQ
ncbi:ATP-binding protein [Streptomyces sp. AC602_WCS936]|uniref:ATP-binding protein n=1 Tax=Streptomyces sp. AC602_WCS936 TaxID=2823685 RepID=UPI001C278725|nr:ATP-binding protein [Streptomyces sp. AC602_WCS936]